MRDARPDESGRYAAWVFMWFGVLAVVAGCLRETPPDAANDADELRIVSFMPSATRIVVDLGLGDRIVGVAEHDAAAPAINADGDPMPIVGHFMDVDVERLMALRPSHVIFPETETGIPGSFAESMRDSGAVVLSLEYPSEIIDVMGSIAKLGRVFGRRDQAATLLEALSSAEVEAKRSRDGVHGDRSMVVFLGGESARGGVGPTVLVVFAVDPVVASGPGSINDELIELAGGVNAVGDAAVSAVTLDREALIDTNPEVVVLMLPGASEAEAAEKIAWFDGLPIAAVRDGRVHAMTDPQVLLPATNLPEVLAELVGLVWGDDEERKPADLSAGFTGSGADGE